MKVASSNLIYRGPTDDIGDLWCQRIQRGRIETVWELTPDERDVLFAGGKIIITLFGEPIAPMAVHVEGGERVASVGEHGWKGQDADSGRG